MSFFYGRMAERMYTVYWIFLRDLLLFDFGTQED